MLTQSLEYAQLDPHPEITYSGTSITFAQGDVVSFEFTLAGTSTVSLGFVANLSGNVQAWITKVELLKQF